MNRPFFDKFEARSLKLAQRYLVATAADARKAVKASLKSGGKNRYSKTYKTSAPGEPPLTHGKRLKQSIRYDVENPALVRIGAPSISGSKTAKVLEKGGAGKITETRTRDDYFERRKKNARQTANNLRKRKGCQNYQSDCRRAPSLPTKRPYTLVSESGAARRVSKYERFKSEEKAKRASNAPEFQRWREKVQKTTTTETNVKPRPFVKPGVEKVTEEAVARARWARLVRTGRLRK